MSSVTLPSPAKINLFLHITGRRDNGYHDLQTVFQLLDFGDTLTFTPNNTGQINLSPQIEGVLAEDNLIVRAARLLQQKTAGTRGCDIVLNKVLPMGAGLGGGSSNAATTLLALNNLWECDLSLDELAKFGAKLGADVPVFVEGNSAFAEGIGEQLTPVEIPESWYLVITPDCHCVDRRNIFTSSIDKELFTHQNTRPLRRSSTGMTAKLLLKSSIHRLKKSWSGSETYQQPLMTGTGASVFCRWATEAQAKEVLSRVPQHWNAFIAQGVNHSPVHQKLKEFFIGASPSG